MCGYTKSSSIYDLKSAKSILDFLYRGRKIVLKFQIAQLQKQCFQCESIQKHDFGAGESGREVGDRGPEVGREVGFFELYRGRERSIRSWKLNEFEKHARPY